MSGFGIFQWPSGNVYEGEWLANRRHGLGKLTDLKGRIRQTGFWQMGKFIREEKTNLKLGFGSDDENDIL